MSTSFKMERTSALTNIGCPSTAKTYGFNNFCLSIIEILASILEKSFGRQESLVLSVMIRSITETLDDMTWFYIKRQRFTSLFKLLNKMQLNEKESHLCLQHPSTDGRSDSFQENLILIDNQLSTQRVQFKAKSSRFYTVYLRVHLELWQMSEACAEIHNYMLLSRIFRPKDNLSFCMDFADVVTETDFSFKTSQKVTSTLPEIVTDSKFYSKKRDSSSYRLLRVAPNVSTSTVHGLIQKQLKCDFETIEIDLVGLCFQHAEDSKGDGKASSFNISFFGPGFAPYTVLSTSEIEDLMKCIDWDLYGMKVKAGDKAIPLVRGQYHGFLQHKKSSQMDSVHLETFIVAKTDSKMNDSDFKLVLEDSICDVKKKLREIYEQLLQPYLSLAKRRSMLDKSIKSVCKGLTDVITLSSSDAFRSKAMEIMKASDTADLNDKVWTSLRDMSSRKHNGMFLGKIVSCDMASNGEHVSDNNQHLTESQDQIVPTEENNLVSVSNNEIQAFGIQIDESCNNGDDELDLNEIQRDLRPPFTGYIVTKSHDPADSLIMDNTKYDGGCRLQTNQNDIAVSPFYELSDQQDNEDRTPEITQLSKCFKEVSPFQELAIEEALDEDPFVQESTEAHKSSRATNEFIKCNMSAQIFNEHNSISPEYEFYSRDEESVEDKTPEITELTQIFKEVSPFQELAATDMNIDEELLLEDPFKEITDDEQFKNKTHTVTTQGAPFEKREMGNNANILYTSKSTKSNKLLSPCATLFEETRLKQTDQQIDCLEEDSDDWFNDVLIEVDHWLK